MQVALVWKDLSKCGGHLKINGEDIIWISSVFLTTLSILNYQNLG